MGSLFGQGKGPPGGLSINTAAANSTTSQPPPSVSLFPPKSGGGLFGGSSSTATSAGTLFGTSTATTTQPPSLFGNTASAPSQAGTLFGGAAAAAPTAAGSLFGGPAAQNQPASTMPSGGSLFGGPATTTSSSNPFASLAASKPLGQPQPASNPFGSLGSSQPQQNTSLFAGLGGNQQPQGSNPFGASLQQQQQQQQQPQRQQTLNSFGFGQTQNQQPQNLGNSLFAPTQTAPRNTFQASSVSTLGPGQQPQRSIFSASIGQYTQAAQTVPGVRISLENLRPTTRFEDLHEELQRGIEQLDSEILNQMRLADECSSLLPTVADVGVTIPPDVAFLESKLDSARTALVTDASAIDAAKRQVRSDASDAQRSFHTIAALRMPSHLLGRSTDLPAPGAGDPAAAGAPGDPSVGGGGDAAKQGNLVSYFSGQADSMSNRLARVQRHFGEVEQYLSGLEAQTATQVQNLRMGRREEQSDVVRKAGPDDRIRELAAVLREFESGILTVATSVGKAREMVQEVQLADGDGPRWRR